MRLPGIRYKPWLEPQVVALRSKGQTYAKIGETMGLSRERVRVIWERYLRRERRKCLGCNPEPLELDMEGMTVTMHWLA